MMKQEYKYWTTTRENCGGIQVHKFFAIETAFEYKFLIAMETAERNTSKQVSAKETALWNVYKYSRIIYIYIFLKWNECRETEAMEWNEGGHQDGMKVEIGNWSRSLPWWSYLTS